VPDLYDAVAYGMWAYSNAAFRVEILGRQRLELAPGTVILVTHRRETDVPVICPPLYRQGGMRRDVLRMSFAARDDMFLPGFFAGFPPDLSPRARRLLYRIGVSRWLPVVKVYPIRSANIARLGEVLRARPDAALEELVPAGTASAFRARATEAGLGRPVRAAEVLRGEYADLLWRGVSPGDGVLDGLAEFWSARATQAARDFRTLVEILRRPGTLVVFPEGRPSPDGEIGPLRPGIGALLRRGRPVSIQPLALAYDPLVRGRTRVFVALPKQVPPPEGGDEAALFALMRRSMPLTCGQFVAHRLAKGAEADPGALARELGEAVEAARTEARQVEPELLSPAGRRRRLAEALSVAPRKPRELPFLALEYESARAS
jgi:1-acyl-sn-glycerol-3-phosphate acyltransferase